MERKKNKDQNRNTQSSDLSSKSSVKTKSLKIPKTVLDFRVLIKMLNLLHWQVL